MDPDCDERAIKRHWFDQQLGTDQERIIDRAVDREFEGMSGDERLQAGRDWRKA